MKPITDTDLEQLSAYLDGELSDSERRFFQKRLSADPALREACERAWLASSVLKAQPFQLMPTGSAAQICAQCPGSEAAPRQSWRMVASVAALAVVLGLGYQLSRDTTPNLDAPLQAQTVPQAAPLAKPEASRGPVEVKSMTDKTMVANTVPSKNAAPSPVQADDPTRFVLNDATRSKAWPKREQGMDDYLARHNQMTDAAAGSDLITYAQWVSEPELAGEQANTDQDKK
jgi:anti-sigma factor RsiW